MPHGRSQWAETTVRGVSRRDRRIEPSWVVCDDPRNEPYPCPLRANREAPLRLPWYPVLVHGPWMAPTLRHGDVLLVSRRSRVRPGDVVVARFRTRPDLLVVKRVARAERDGWWLVGDNTYVADDSRAYG